MRRFLLDNSSSACRCGDNPAFVMQVLADVLNRPISVSASTQACARGAAMYAAVAAGLHDSLQEAQAVMSAGFSAIYAPQKNQVVTYTTLYQKYRTLGDFIDNHFDE